MRKRYLYGLLFGIPALPIALLVSFLVFGAAAGFFWIYVFGDNTWPAFAGTLLTGLWVLTFLIVWLALTTFGYRFGKKQEHDPEFNRRHLALSVGLTLLPLALMALHQKSVGNIGEKSPGVLCRDYCSSKDYAINELSPASSGIRSCRCLDESGQIILEIPLEEIVSSQ